MYCSAHFTAVLLTNSSQSESEGSSSSQEYMDDLRIDSLSSGSTDSTTSIQDLLLEAYQQIGDPDGLYGYGAGRLPDCMTRVKTYEHEGDWAKAVITYDIDISQTVTCPNIQILKVDSYMSEYTDTKKAVENFGAVHILDTCFEKLASTGQTEICPEIQELQYKNAWKTGQWTLDTNVCRNEEVLGFNQAIYLAISSLKDGHHSQAKTAVEAARNGFQETRIESPQCIYPVLSDLQCVSQITDFIRSDWMKAAEEDFEFLYPWDTIPLDDEQNKEFDFLEPTFSVRCSLLRMLYSKIAERAMSQLKDIHIDNMSLTRMLHGENTEAERLYPKVLSIYGDWLAETRSENPNVIMDQYLEKIAESEMEKLKQLGDVSKDRYYRTLLKQSDIDKEELKIMNEDRNKFLLKAVTNYIKCLKCGDKHDLRIFRLTSLWFNNSTLEEVNMEIEDCCQNIKSYKFLPLMYQLAARMDMKSTNYKFQDTLNKVIERAAVDHPYHTLFCVLALANAKKDTELLKTGQSAKRIQAAKNMIQKLRTGKTNVSDIVVNMEKLCEL
ncbi:hypothetical protein KUTeg_007197 [Tegillarca granosa]|uniref:FAT domain-containing protein n=1 Tax=Tegillarca granosa TaxID=220873 RepID=A0ABQ9FEX0_TEGGR|nr:hypothetical protein KUTeg_007197 [Tegillarca granosa]